MPFCQRKARQLKDTSQDAGWIRRIILSDPHHLASVVDFVRSPVITAERGERGHHAILPKEGETYEVGMESAKIFRKRIWTRSLRTTRDLAPLVEWKACKAVRPTEGPQVSHHAVPPEKRVPLHVARQGRKALYPTSVVHTGSLGKRSAQRAQVGDCVVRGAFFGPCVNSRTGAAREANNVIAVIHVHVLDFILPPCVQRAGAEGAVQSTCGVQDRRGQLDGASLPSKRLLSRQIAEVNLNMRDGPIALGGGADVRL